MVSNVFFPRLGLVNKESWPEAEVKNKNLYGDGDRERGFCARISILSYF